MKKLGLVVVLALVISIFSACGGGSSSGKVVVDINGNKITQGDLDLLGDINPRIKAQLLSPIGRKGVIENLVEQELLYQEAIKQGLNRDSEVKAKIDLYRKVIIAQSLVESDLKKAAKKYYDEHPEEFKKLKMSQIMIKYESPEEIKKAKKSAKGPKIHTEQEALKIIEGLKAKIDAGEDFAKIARENSEDVATRSKGGDIGMVSKDDQRLAGRGMAPLVDKAFEMSVDQVSGPIKTAKGYHLIMVTKAAEVEDFSDAEQSILFKMRGDSKNDLLTKLKKDATIVYSEEEEQKKEEKRTEKKGLEKFKMKAAEQKAEKASGAENPPAEEKKAE